MTKEKELELINNCQTQTQHAIDAYDTAMSFVNILSDLVDTSDEPELLDSLVVSIDKINLHLDELEKDKEYFAQMYKDATESHSMNLPRFEA